MNPQNQDNSPDLTPISQEGNLINSSAQSASSILGDTVQNMQPPPPSTQPPSNPTIPSNILPTPSVIQPIMSTPGVLPQVPNTPISGGENTPAYKPKKRRFPIPVIVGVASGLFIMSAVAFYFFYWTTSATVYARFQKNIAKVVSATGESEFDLINNLTYKVEVNSESDKLNLKALSDGRAVDSGFDSLSDITYKGATLNVGLRTVNNEQKGLNSFYLKFKGISSMYDAVYSDSPDQQLGLDKNKLNSYDDKWIFIDLDSLIGGLAEDGSSANEKPLTKEVYQQLWDIFNPIISSRLVGLDSGNDVYKTSNPRTEKINSKSTWAYDVEFDSKAFNEMLDEMSKAVDDSTLDESYKKTVKSAIESSKRYIPKENNSDSTDSFSSKYKLEEKTTIWIEKNSGIPLQIQLTSESSYDGKFPSKSSTTITIDSISKDLIKGSSKIESISDYSSDTAQINFSIDNKQKSITANGEYTTIVPDENDTQKITFTVTAEQNKDKTAVEKPAESVPIEDVWKDIYSGSDF